MVLIGEPVHWEPNAEIKTPPAGSLSRGTREVTAVDEIFDVG